MRWCAARLSYDRATSPRLPRRPLRIAPRHAVANVVLDAVLREGVAEAVLGECRHAGNSLLQVLGGSGHQHLVVVDAAVAALGEAGDGERRLAQLERAAPAVGAGALADDAPLEILITGPLQAVDEIHHGA